MNFLTRFSLRNAVAIFIISFLLILAGLYSFSRLKVDLLPNIEFPTLSVETIYPGASPEDVDENVTSKLEDQLDAVEGVKSITSTSFDSVSIINMEFPFSADIDEVEQQVENILKEANLPDSTSTEINRFSFGTFPIFNISLFGVDDTSVEEVVDTKLLPELNKINGINSISVGGRVEELLSISVDPDKATQYGLTLEEIRKQITDKSLSFPAGTITSESIEIPVRVQEKVDTIQTLRDLTITPAFSNPNAPVTSITLGDIAEIKETSEKPEITRFNLEESLSMAVTKKQDANTVEVADQVLEVLNKYDDEIRYSIGFDSAEGITKSVETLVKEGLLGALFASIAVLLFLRNVRATIIAIISIPLSLLVASIFLYQLDISLNIMTLGGMAVAVGRVVDDSIVVIENIFRRVRKSQEGMTNDLIETSTKEILKAITSSTITTVVVFLPLGFVGGITGEFFLPFALTIIFALLTSLIVAITIVPILAKFSFKKVPPEEKEGKMERAFGKVILWSLKKKWIVISLSVLTLLGGLGLTSSLGFTFIPNEEQKLLVASVRLPSSTSLERTNEIALELEQYFDQNDTIEDVTAGIGSRDFQTGLKRKNQANYFLSLNENAEVASFIPELQSQMEEIVFEMEPEATLGVQEQSTGGPPSNNNVNIDLFSDDLDALQEASIEVENYMNSLNTLKYVSNNFSEKQKQIVVDIDSKKASELGISGFQVLGTISDQTRPVTINDFSLTDSDRSLQIQYEQDQITLDDLNNLPLFTSQGVYTVSDVAQVKEVESFTSIQKLDGNVYARISAQIVGDNIQAVTQEVINGVQDNVTLPNGVSFEGGGGSDETVETFQQLGLAMLIAIGLVYITMLITFGKARIPFIILSSLIFVPIGSLFGLFIAQEPLSVSVMIGFLMLIGIVTTNAIVMVDRVGQNIEEKGMFIREALVEAGKTRLRPILMTAFATITALLPLAFTTSSGTLISKGLAITVIGGLTSSTLLTLVLLPVLYELFFFKESKKQLKEKQ
ncbi:efflux RND transporter permease subunit [Mangrovibacillus cuniculi]|uniref:Efflux RND transporter permease subunit n=1 Tax=Mangrovibacillus cuniculi TaxID=2593652 RepID=A0A7S8HEW4_9BACI|nr:efflux RND transporter permease subunit [Mangrovibacillus cuniculi]QPC46147.1 efflux RND transporter permease subunit [Mangrovibacillus cuniculi]